MGARDQGVEHTGGLNEPRITAVHADGTRRAWRWLGGCDHILYGRLAHLPRFARHRRHPDIQRTAHPARATIEDMGINHRGLQILVAQQFLHGANVVTTLKQVRRKRVA